MEQRVTDASVCGAMPRMHWVAFRHTLRLDDVGNDYPRRGFVSERSLALPIDRVRYPILYEVHQTFGR